MIVSMVLLELDWIGSTEIKTQEAGLIFIRKLQNGRYHVVRVANIKNIFELSKVGLIQFLYSVKER